MKREEIVRLKRLRVLGLRRSLYVLIILFAEVEHSTVTADPLGDLIPVDYAPIDYICNLLGVLRVFAVTHDCFLEEGLNQIQRALVGGSDRLQDLLICDLFTRFLDQGLE
jgi:hypothetical protein